jgi:hypothetical protein
MNYERTINKLLKHLLPVLFLCCGAKAAQSQFVQDVQLRTAVKLTKTFKKDYTIALQYQVRADKYISNFRGSYLTASFEYKVNKYFSIEAGYRYSTSPIRDSHRFYISPTGKYKIGDFTISNRLTYQRQHPYFNRTYEEGNEPTDYIRNRLQVKWDFVKHWDVYASIEPFFLLQNRGNVCDRIRNIVGFDWVFTKNHTLNLYYMFQPDVNQANPDFMHAIGLTYEWDLPKFKKKKGKDGKKA